MYLHVYRIQAFSIEEAQTDQQFCSNVFQRNSLVGTDSVSEFVRAMVNSIKASSHKRIEYIAACAYTGKQNYQIWIIYKAAGNHKVVHCN